jgi:type III pantothenate kinase
MSILAVDVGNTVTRLGLFEQDELLATWDMATRDTMTVDEIRLALHGFLKVLDAEQSPARATGSEQSFARTTGSEQTANGIQADNARADGADNARADGADGADSAGSTAPMPDDGIISCVVPSLTSEYASALEKEFGRRPLIVGPGLKTGIKMHYNDPAEVGPDRIAAMVAAAAAYALPLAVVDLGTATNILVLDAQGVFIGGLIAPGLELSARALSQTAAWLPVIEISPPEQVIGKSTRDAMRSGFILGETARIEGLIDMIWSELGEEGEVILTGTDANKIAPLLAYDVQVDDTITLRGLALLYTRNRKRS